MKRNPSIELYRIALMYGICLLHSITMGNHNVPWAANILCSCVVIIGLVLDFPRRIVMMLLGRNR